MRKQGVLKTAAMALWLCTTTIQSETLDSQYWPVLSQAQVQALIDTVYGETTRDHIRFISQYWRWAPSQGFHQVAEYMVDKARSYGLEDAHIERFVADGNTSYLGVRMKRPFWDPQSAELWVVEPERQKITSFADVPMCVVGYSRNTDVEAEVVDVGAGTSAQDYEGREVRGKIVLGTGAVGSLQRLAVFERGALGVLSAWTPENQTSRSPLDYPDHVTWGTGVVPESKTGQPSTFGFMLSRRQHQVLQDLLKNDRTVRVHARVEARFEEPGYLEAVTATIPGRDSAQQEVVFSAHLEHPKPAANDNTSGSAVILEIARVLQKLIQTGELAPPRRTIRFLWVQEGRSTRAYLDRHPEIVQGTLANINMDIVGSEQEKTKAILYLWRSPASRPTFASDIVQDFFELVRHINNDRMPTEPLHPILAATGNRRPFVGQVERYRRPSDQSNFIAVGVPAINFAAWPDQYHHTPFDTPDKSDPTQLERVAFIGAAAAAVLSSAGPEDSISLLNSVLGRGQSRLGEDLTRAMRWLGGAAPEDLDEVYKEARNIIYWGRVREEETLQTIRAVMGQDEAALAYLERQKAALAEMEASAHRQLQDLYTIRARGLGRPLREPVLSEAEKAADRRIPSWLHRVSADSELIAEELDPEKIQSLEIFRHSGDPSIQIAAGAIFNFPLFETLNFIDGKRSVRDIRDAVSAEFRPVAIEVIDDFINALVEAKLLKLADRP